MKKNLLKIHLILSALSTTAFATTAQKDKAFQIPNNGIFSLLEDRQELCSGSLVYIPKTGQTVVATAHHCFSTDAKESHNRIPGYAGGAMSVVVGTINNSFSKAVVFDTHISTSYWNAPLDIVLTKPLSYDKEKLPVLKLAAKLPNYGESIEFEGFPVNMLFGTALRKHVTCRYLGPMEYPAIHNKVDTKLVILQAAACPYNEVAEGMSGGPVTNSKNQFIGLLSLKYNDSMLVRNNIVKSNESLILFSGVTEDLISPNYQTGYNGVMNFKGKEFDQLLVFKAMGSKGPFGQNTFSVVPALGKKINIDLTEGVYDGDLVTTYPNGQQVIVPFKEGHRSN